MSGSRKRDSKWNSGVFHDREPEHGYFSTEVGRKDKWSGAGVSDMMKSKHGLSSRGSLHRSRVGEKDDNNDFVKNWNTSTPWDRDDTYSMKMSPGLDDRGLKKHHSSPKGDWNRSHRHRSRSWSRSNSRSRSRSPVRGTRSQLGFHERSRNKSEVSTQLCKEFMAGRCRRGSQCHFLHQDIQSREDGWDNRQKRAVASKYITHDDGKDNLIKSGRSSDCCIEYMKGNCRKGASCRFAHDGASDGFSRRQTHQISNERENTKRNRVRTPEREGEREVRRSGGDIPCTYFAAGNCRNGKYCRFSHHGQARASLERSRDDRGVWDPSSTSVNKLHDGSAKRDADASFNVNKSWNVPERSDANALNEAEIPWNGSKWSNLDASNNVNNSWTGSKWSDLDASNNVNNSWTGSKWSDADASNNVNNSLTGSKWSDADASNDVNNSRTGSKWSDASAYSGATRLSKDTIGKKGVSEPRFSKWSVDERWQHEYDVSGKNIVANRQCKTVDIDKDEGIPRKIENAGVNMGASEPKCAEDPLADMEMSPEWNYRIQSSVKKEHSQSAKPAPGEVFLPAREKTITEEASGQVHHGLEALQPMLTEKSNIQQDHLKRGSSAVLLPCVSNALNSNSNSHVDLKFSTNIPPLPSFDQPGPSPSSLSYSNFNAVGRSQVSILSNEITTSGTHNSLMFQEQASNNLNTGDTNILQGNSGSQSTQPMVSNEQLTQLTNLSASLAQLFGKGQQLPLLNGMQVNPSTNSGDHLVLDSVPTVQPEQVTFPKQYDPVSDSIESGKKQGIGTKPLEILVDPVTEKITADEQPELSANKLLVSSLLGSNNGDVYHNDHSLKRETDFNSHKPNQLQLVASSDVKEDDGVEETKKTEGENGPSENVDVDDKTDEGKKNKDDKGIRAFKFALVEFVKDLLKPTWKDGQIGKEAYKNIVKKVVDKVIATVQGTSIPQTAEKIDQYLSLSKPKLSKLVQAYVTKFQKS